MLCQFILMNGSGLIRVASSLDDLFMFGRVQTGDTLKDEYMIAETS